MSLSEWIMGPRPGEYPPPLREGDVDRKLLPSPSVIKATSPSFRNVPHPNGLNRSALVRSTAGEIASAAEMARINLTFPGDPSLLCKLRKTYPHGSIVRAPEKEVGSNPSLLFKLIQIGIWSGIAQDAAHGDDLALVMEGVGQDVMKDQGGRPDRNVAIREMELFRGNEVLLAEA